MCPPALYCCVRLCLAILYIYLPALDVASSSFDFEKHKLFGVYGGVICLPVLFICLPSSVLVVGFAAGLSPTSFHLSPTSFHLSPSSFPTSCHMSPTSFHLSPRLGACGPVPGWLVSHFLSFVSHFFSFPKQFTVRGSQCFKEWSPWCWMVWSGPAGLSPTSFYLSPSSFHLSPKLGACGRVRGWLVSHFLSFVSQFFSHFLSYVSHFFSFVSQAGRLWSGSRLACLPLPFICLALLFICPAGSCGRVCGWLVSHVLSFVSHFFHLSPSSFHFWSPRLGACGRVPGWLVSHFLSFPKQFTVRGSQCFKEWSPWCWMVWSGPAGLSPTSFYLSPSSFHLSPKLGACGRVRGWLVSHFLSCVSHFFSFVSQFFSHFLSYVSHFFSFVSQAGCLWSGSRLACLPLPFICLALLFIPQTVYC